MGINIEVEDFCVLSFYQLQTKIDELFKKKDNLKHTDEYYDNKMKNINVQINTFQIEQEKLVTVNYN